MSRGKGFKTDQDTWCISTGGKETALLEWERNHPIQKKVEETSMFVSLYNNHYTAQDADC